MPYKQRYTGTTFVSSSSTNNNRKNSMYTQSGPPTHAPRHCTDNVRIAADTAGETHQPLRDSTYDHDTHIAIQQFRKEISKGPTHPCACCLRLSYKQGVLKLNKDKYSNMLPDVLDKCITGFSNHGNEWICKRCHYRMLRGSMPAQANTNNLQLAQIPTQLKSLCSLEVQLI